MTTKLKTNNRIKSADFVSKSDFDIMPKTVHIQKAYNGYTVTHNGKVHVAKEDQEAFNHAKQILESLI